MKDRSWVNFRALAPNPKTKRWAVDPADSRPPNVPLGIIEWYVPWRKYAFSPTSNTVFEERCLRDIALFCEQQTHAHRLARRMAAKNV